MLKSSLCLLFLGLNVLIASGQTNTIPGDPVIFNGKVGIGTTAPLDLLHVRGPDATATGIRLETPTPGRSFSILSVAGTDPRLTILDINAGSERFSIDSAGRVGVGTNAPSSQLEVVGSIKVSGSGSGITFPDGTKQTSALAGGPQGPQGIQGPKGDKGDTGPQGPPGPTQSIVVTSIIQTYSNSADVVCPAGYIVLVASCKAGTDVVINAQDSPINGGSPWQNWLTPNTDNSTGVHCSIGLSNSSTVLLRCSKLQ